MISPARHFDPNHARVLVVGPMAAGKTTLVHSLCHRPRTAGVAAVQPPPTVGCNVDVKLLVGGGRADRSVEFWDVGGNPDAALARGMFFKDSETAGVLLVYDLSNPRSLRELRAWADELASEGVQILDCGRNNSIGGAGRGGASAADGVLDVGDTALRRRERHGGLEWPADVEGGSRGTATAVGGRVPLLVVGTKEDMGEGFRREGAELAADLGAGHIAVCAKKLNDEEPFDRFFGEVFRHHSGQGTPGDGGGAHEWGTERQEGQDTYFPTTTAGGDSSTDGSNVGRDHPSAGSWRGELPENTAQQRGALGSTITGSWRRAGGPSFGEVDRIRGSSGGSRGKGGAAGAGAGLVWPVNRGALPKAAAAAGVHRSREKQS